MRKRKKVTSRCLVITLFILMLIDIGSDGVIPNSVKGWLGGSPFRHCCKIEDPVFMEHCSGEWFIMMDTIWYPMEMWYLKPSQYLNEISRRDSCRLYKYKPAYYREKFGHYFEPIYPCSCYTDDIPHDTGRYRHTCLLADDHWWRDIPKIVYNGKGERPAPLNLRMFWLSSNLRDKWDRYFTRPTSGLPDVYEMGKGVVYHSPMIYIPFPLSGKGYLFSKDVYRDSFKEMIQSFGNQNFYAVLVEIPEDIRRLGEVVSLDKNGVLLNLKRDKTPRLNMELHRLHDDMYEARVKYNKTHRKNLISDGEYQTILKYSDSSTVSSPNYDETIFINLRPILSELACKYLQSLIEIHKGYDYDTTYCIKNHHRYKDTTIYDGGHNPIWRDTIINDNIVYIENLATEECSDRIIIYNPSKELLLRAYNMSWHDYLNGNLDILKNKPYVIESLDVENRILHIRFCNDSIVKFDLYNDYPD